MDPFIKADIFFFISSMFVILIGIFLLVLLAYLLKIVRNVKEVSNSVKNTVKNIATDVDSKRKSIKEDGVVWQDMVGFFTRKSKPKRKKRRLKGK